MLHSGLFPEAAVIDALQKIISLAQSPDVPELYSAVMAHYIFEYAHPFYDGNGRTGRRPLALNLSRPQSLATSLSISRAVAESKASYHRAFREVENPLNHGELTFFALRMLGYIESAQQETIESTSDKEARLREVRERASSAASRSGVSAKARDILLQMAETELFAPAPGVTLREAAGHVGLSE